MPKIGLRNIKTAVSVTICLTIYFVIILLAYIGYEDFSKSIKLASTLYTPFFACIASAYSVSTDKGKSISQAKLRCLASLVGGLFGVFLIVIYTKVFDFKWPFSYISSTGNPVQGFTDEMFTKSFMLSFIAPVIITGLGTVMVIWICNLLHHSELSFVSVLTFTAVMVSLGTNPIIYGPNRILSTIVGVLVALSVNLFHIPHYHNVQKLFIVGLDGIYVADNKKLNGYTEYKVSNLIADGANITYYSTRTPVRLISMIGHVKLNKPVLCMSGAALYDISKKEYLYVENMSQTLSNEVYQVLKNADLNPFVNFIEDNVLYTYIEELKTDAEKLYAYNRKNSAYGCFVRGLAYAKDVCYFLMIIKKETALEVRNMLIDLGFDNDLLILDYDCYEISEELATDGYVYLKIYSKKVLDLKALSLLGDNYKLIGAGKHQHDDILFSKCDEVITNLDGKDLIKTNNKVVLNSHNTEQIFKKLGKSYHSKS